jgi:polyisoprenoid-binding protein YceI
MKKYNILILIISMIFTQVVNAEDDSYIIDESHFSLGFLVEHAGYAKTLGMFKKVSGSFNYDKDKNLLSNVEIIIDTSSVFTNHEKRDAHLRSPDFLDVDKFPTMRFIADNNNLNASPNKVTGELILLGISKKITLHAVINKIEKYPFGFRKPIVMGVSATASFNRTDYGMDYAVGENGVGDQIDLIIEFEAIKQ